MCWGPVLKRLKEYLNTVPEADTNEQYLYSTDEIGS